MRSFSPEHDDSIVPASSPEYPARLRELRRPPDPLYARGMLACAAAPAVAIVGTRHATPYGVRTARALATACARAGIAVVSGLAQGIDAAAHVAALEAGGRTVAVLGTGLDRCYPRTHHALQQRIGEEGLLLSELPAGSTGHPGSFPERNRIIAALADITVVVEAPAQSGALITADRALELGRTVACVPNAIDVPSAAGSNRLLKAHAEPLLHPDDLLALLQMTPLPPHGPVLSGAAAACWAAIADGKDEPSTIAAHSSLTQREVTIALGLLEIDGLIQFDAVGRITPTVLITA
jgi:DNA processing protein